MRVRDYESIWPSIFCRPTEDVCCGLLIKSTFGATDAWTNPFPLFPDFFFLSFIPHTLLASRQSYLHPWRHGRGNNIVGCYDNRTASCRIAPSRPENWLFCITMTPSRTLPLSLLLQSTIPLFIPTPDVLSLLLKRRLDSDLPNARNHRLSLFSGGKERSNHRFSLQPTPHLIYTDAIKISNYRRRPLRENTKVV